MRIRALILIFAGSLSAGEDTPAWDGPAINEIHIRGNTRVSEIEVLELLEAGVGTPYSIRMLDRMWGHLEYSDRFSRIKITPQLDACGVILNIDLTEWPLVEHIRIEGIAPALERAFLDVLFARTDKVYDRHFLELDRMRIRDALLARGYCHVTVTVEPSFDQWSKDTGDTIEIRYKVDLGPLVKIKSIVFDDNNSIDSAELLKELRIKVGDPACREYIYDEERTLENAYRRRGFLNAAVVRTRIIEPELKSEGPWPPPELPAEVTFTIVEGLRQRVTAVTFVGNKQLPDSALSTVIKSSSGAEWNQFAIVKDCQALKKLYRERGFPLPAIAIRYEMVSWDSASNSNKSELTFEIKEVKPRSDMVVEYRN